MKGNRQGLNLQLRGDSTRQRCPGVPLAHRPARCDRASDGGVAVSASFTTIPTPTIYNEMAADIVRQHDLTDEVSECGYACAWVDPYGWVPEADCPIHDAPRLDT